jgi:ribosomal protein S18 acetylase RimI-like enzyme
MKIEKATIKDAEEILELQKKAFHSEAEIHQNFSIPPMVQTLESIQEDFSTYMFYKGVIEEKIVASVKVRILEDNQLWVGRLIVHPDYQNRGLGKNLMLHIEKLFSEVDSYLLFTAQKSRRNIYFYGKLGYTIESKFTESGHDDILLVKMVKLRQTLV